MSEMRKLVIVLFISLVVITGCGKKHIDTEFAPTTKEKYEFEVTHFSFAQVDYDKSNKLEVREVYKYFLPIVELVSHGNYSSSKNLYLMNLESNDVKLVEGIEKQNSNNRIWSFVETSENEYVYIELIYGEMDGDTGLIKYTINYSNQKISKLLYTGFCVGIYNLPVFLAQEERLFISGATYSDRTTGIENYSIYFGEIKNKSLDILFSKDSLVIENQLSKDAEILYGTAMNVDENSVMFFTEIQNVRFVNVYKDGQMEKFTLNNQGVLIYSIPVNDYLLCYEIIDNNENYYLLNSKLEKVKDLNKINITDFAVTKFGTYIINENGLIFVYLSDDKSELLVKKLENVVNPIYFRLINETDVLVFTDSNMIRITCSESTVK